MAGPIDINVGCSCGQDHPVGAWPSTTPGLAVHRGPVHPDSSAEYWRITRVPTGLCLPAGFDEPEAAMACAAELGSAAEWDWTASEVPPTDVQRRTVDTVDAWGFVDRLGGPGDVRPRNDGAPW